MRRQRDESSAEADASRSNAAVKTVQTIARNAKARRQAIETAAAQIPVCVKSGHAMNIAADTARIESCEAPADDEWLSDYDFKHLKASKARACYILAEEGLDPTNDEEWCVVQAMLSVLPTTFMEYASHWRALRRAGLPISEAGAQQFIANRSRDPSAKQQVAGTLKHLLSSITFYHECYGSVDMRKQTMRMIQGITSKDRAKMSAMRGGITEAKLRQMLRLPDSVIPREYKDYFILLHATGMRGNQLGRTFVQHVYPMTGFVGTRWIVLCPANHKGRGATASTNSFEYHETHPEWAEDLRRIFAAASEAESGMLAPNWSATLGNKYVKDAATRLKWDSKMIWVVHGFRHGSAIDAANSCDGNISEILTAVQRYTGHISPSMLLMYSKSNEARELTEAARRELRSTLCQGRSSKETHQILQIVERGIQRKAEVRQNHAEVKSELVRVKAEQAKVVKRLVGGK